MNRKKLVENFSKYLRPYIYIAALVILLGFSKVTKLQPQWTAIGVLIIFISTFLREKFEYFIGTFVILTILFILTKNILAYNFFFKILIIGLVMGLMITFLEDMSKAVITWIKKHI